MYEQLKIKNCTYKEVTREEYLCISFTLGLSVSWICSDKKNKHMKQIVTLFFQNSWRQNVNLFDWFILIILTVILYTGDTNIAFYQVFWTKKMKKTNGFAILVGYLELKHWSSLMHIIYIFKNVLKAWSNVSIFKIKKRIHV